MPVKRVSSGILSNGFRFYTQYDPRAHVSGIGVKVGSVHDPLLRRGLAHLNEHRRARYTREEELRFYEYVCGPDQPGINIRTDYMSTYFGTNLLLKKKYGRELFDIMAGYLRNLPVERNSLRSEMAAVLNEYRLRGIDWVEAEIEPMLNALMYEKNPAHNRVDCEPDELLRVRCRDMQGFDRAHYVANNMFAILLDVPFLKARKICEEKFGDLPSGEIPKLAYDFSESRPALTDPKIVEISREGISMHHVAVAFPTFPSTHKDSEALEVLAKIWEFRVRRALRDDNVDPKKGVYRVIAYTPQTAVHGMIYLWFASQSEEFAHYGADRALEECKTLRERYVLSDELQAMIGHFRNDYIDDFTNVPEELAERIIHAATNGDEEMRGLNSYLGRLARVGKKCLLRVANEYLTPNPLTLFVKPADLSARK